MEQRYQAVLAVVQDGWRVVEVARRLGVTPQSDGPLHCKLCVRRKVPHGAFGPQWHVLGLHWELCESDGATGVGNFLAGGANAPASPTGCVSEVSGHLDGDSAVDRFVVFARQLDPLGHPV